MNEPTQEQIEVFREAWKAADTKGKKGDRVRAGLRAVFSMREKPFQEAHPDTMIGGRGGNRD